MTEGHIDTLFPPRILVVQLKTEKRRLLLPTRPHTEFAQVQCAEVDNMCCRDGGALVRSIFMLRFLLDQRNNHQTPGGHRSPTYV